MCPKKSLYIYIPPDKKKVAMDGQGVIPFNFPKSPRLRQLRHSLQAIKTNLQPARGWRYQQDSSVNKWQRGYAGTEVSLT